MKITKHNSFQFNLQMELREEECNHLHWILARVPKVNNSNVIKCLLLQCPRQIWLRAFMRHLPGIMSMLPLLILFWFQHQCHFSDNRDRQPNPMQGQCWWVMCCPGNGCCVNAIRHCTISEEYVLMEDRPAPVGTGLQCWKDAGEEFPVESIPTGQ